MSCLVVKLVVSAAPTASVRLTAGETAAVRASATAAMVVAVVARRRSASAPRKLHVASVPSVVSRTLA